MIFVSKSKKTKTEDKVDLEKEFDLDIRDGEELSFEMLQEFKDNRGDDKDEQ